MQQLYFSLAATVLASSLALTFSAHAAPALPLVQEAPLRAHLAFLSNDLLEGRGTGQRGADLTVAYLETQAQMAGLRPVRGNSYRQSVQIAGVKSLPQDSSLQAVAAGKIVPLAFGPDWVWATGDSVAAHAFDAPLVFVGYGITAPEEGWNDFKGVDVKGKIVVMMVNDPQPTVTEPQRFAGKALTYYGRWTYKFEEAQRQGAAGVLLIHTKPSASYDWSVVQNSWSGSERFQLAHRAAGTPLQGWIAQDAARRLFAAGGQDLDALRAQAESKDFKAVALDAKLSGEMKSAVRKVEQFNIAGMVPGTDPLLKEEAVIYSGHWDHLGKQGQDDEKAGDIIYNGAVDNASGTAGLLAMAQAAVKKPAKRTQIFLWVAAEEQGLLGSAAYAADPLWPLNKTAAALNLDSLNFVGATHDIGAQGSERTQLQEMAAAVAKSMGMHIAQARPDLAGAYFRSDHFSFAKAGVPAFSINGGREYVKDVAASQAKAAAYGPRYHQVSDEYDASWDLSGMTQQAQFTLNLGQAVANAARMPLWKAGDAFGKVRQPAK
ncbi:MULTISPECIES: M28 family peptidase [unclassified Janthinobacterium]|uniref:M28 family peptidase n=1 Tax=unclassified Janthinobacterium TaxID=2610881 RepID=UPI0018C909D2|nr:M28 family peptidase [Janthinobacterium sp. CG_23.4]MDH6156713.1 Zn-dependent M28 family amino/carboxypeptidase [Janthinobacterium sp. CG_23.4]